MHVFIDTNILLSFYHYAKDELDALNDVFASHEHGSATVHLTQQVKDEFTRNREVKIRDALNTFNAHNLAPQFPFFMKGYEEYGALKNLTKQAKDKKDELLKKVHEDIKHQDLVADKLVDEIFENSELYETTKKLFYKASRRVGVGNPPGKNNSLGDAINWLALLESVPKNKTIHIISRDGDFFSVLREDEPNPFLAEEWEDENGGELRVYRSLSVFMKEHFDGVAFSFDEEKQQVIDALDSSGSFAATHSLVASLEQYAYFSLKEVEAILDAAIENNQFGWITSDYDVCAFLHRVLLPHAASLKKQGHKEILAEVQEEKAKWDEEN